MHLHIYSGSSGGTYSVRQVMPASASELIYAFSSLDTASYRFVFTFERLWTPNNCNPRGHIDIKTKKAFSRTGNTITDVNYIPTKDHFAVKAMIASNYNHGLTH